MRSERVKAHWECGGEERRTLVPLSTTVAFWSNCSPVPVVSTSAEAISREPSRSLHQQSCSSQHYSDEQRVTSPKIGGPVTAHLLKFVIVAVNVLSAFMVIVTEVSNAAAMLVLPQGRALFGR